MLSVSCSHPSRLVLSYILKFAKVQGYDVDVPLLLIYWYNTSTTPSSVLLLDSTVVIPIDKEPKDKWNAARFDIVHARQTENATMKTTRTFTAPRKARDTWVYAISQALLVHEKEKEEDENEHEDDEEHDKEDEKV